MALTLRWTPVREKLKSLVGAIRELQDVVVELDARPTGTETNPRGLPFPITYTVAVAGSGVAPEGESGFTKFIQNWMSPASSIVGGDIFLIDADRDTLLSCFEVVAGAANVEVGHTVAYPANNRLPSFHGICREQEVTLTLDGNGNTTITLAAALPDHMQGPETPVADVATGSELNLIWQSKTDGSYVGDSVVSVVDGTTLLYAGEDLPDPETHYYRTCGYSWCLSNEDHSGDSYVVAVALDMTRDH